MVYNLLLTSLAGSFIKAQTSMRTSSTICKRPAAVGGTVLLPRYDRHSLSSMPRDPTAAGARKFQASAASVLHMAWSYVPVQASLQCSPGNC